MTKKTVRSSGLRKGLVALSALLVLLAAGITVQANYIYRMREGETFYSMSRKFRLPVEVLQRANPRRHPLRLSGGMTIVIPGQEPAQSTSSSAVKRYDWELRQSLLESQPRSAGLKLAFSFPLGITPITPDKPLPSPMVVASATIPPRSRNADSYVQRALSYRGVRYRRGGLSSRGMDCSGLIMRVLLDHGIRVPHSAARLYHYGKPVSKQNLLPGDLVFFWGNGRAIDHVAMYIGEGKIVHAASGRHAVVISSLSEKYYASHYVGARRLSK